MRSVFCWCATIAVCVALCGQAFAQRGDDVKLVFACSPSNDLYRLLTGDGTNFMRFDQPEEAIWFAPEGAGVLILADNYPEEPVFLPGEALDKAVSKRLRVYIEYPNAIPGVYIGPSRTAQWERGVIASDWFMPGLKPRSILGLNECAYVPIDVARPHFVLSRVAGYDSAVYGLPEWVTPRDPECVMFPLLARHPLGDVLIASTKLSHMVTGRYAPVESWRTVWSEILEWLARRPVRVREWEPTVRPTFSAGEPLPEDIERQVLRRAGFWFFKSKLLVHQDWLSEVEKYETAENPVGPPPELHWPVGDGSLGALEGFASSIETDGRQPLRYCRRNDCMSETGMALAFDGVIHDAPRSRDTAANLLDFVHFKSGLAQGPRADVNSPSFGLFGWYTGQGSGVYYGDDNARSMLGTIAAAALLEKTQWDENVMRCLLANLRTTGTKGFRGSRLDEEPLKAAGWRYYFDRGTIHYAPHYEAYLWACFLWAYERTGYAPFLDRTKTAIGMTMKAYPAKWRWTNGLQQERARMLLPLAWLVRIEDTGEHRAWLSRIADDLLADQVPCGAIREELGPEGTGAYGPPKSNEAYGTAEATLLQANGDPVCDLLYTSNFAFLGLHEAAAATGDPRYAKAEKKLAEFFCRIQTYSESHPELDGAWYRAFDYDKWECWGSNGDAGWGAWSIESGWTQAWIASVFALRQMNTSFWELTAKVDVKASMDQLVPVMFPEPEEGLTPK
ncbi:MAG: hypothetical protein GWP08_10245 [Nitrospiraceae bacterium]|nr:hypothetical protein [Nitrospiraceae bacterium]